MITSINKKINSIDFLLEVIIVIAISTVLVFGVELMTGTITSGFHLVDDWEYIKYANWMQLEHKSVIQCICEALEFDLELRFRPLYYINRVIMVAIFGINMTALSVIRAIETIIAIIALHCSAREMGCSIVRAYLFALTVMVGYQSATWWKLGPQECYAMMLFAIAFYCMLKWINVFGKTYEICALIIFFLMSTYKESFILLFPFICLYALYADIKKTGMVSWKCVRNCVKIRLSFYLIMGAIFTIEMILIVFVIGTNNYSYVGLDSSLSFRDISAVWKEAFETDLKWYIRFGFIMLMILMTYWDELKSRWMEGILAISILLPQVITYNKTAITERYILPSSLAIAYVFVILGLKIKGMVGKRRILYILCLILMLAANGRAMLIEANYYAYRGNSVTKMLNTTLDMVEGTDKKILNCLHPNAEADKTMYYWFGLHGFHEIYNWYDDSHIVGKSIGDGYGDEASLEDMDIIVMYNREDRHWCYEPDIDLSEFDENVCGTLTIYVRN